MPKRKIKHLVFSGVEKKKCPRCGFWKDLTHFGKNKAAWDKLTVCCKECEAVTFKKFYDNQSVVLNRRPKTIPHKILDGVEYKRCSVCEDWKVLEEFHRLRSSPDGRYSQCRDCKSVYTKQYSVENKDALSIKRRNYYKKNEGRIKENTHRRYSSDFSYRLQRVFSSSVYRAIKSEKNGISCLSYFDYTIDQLRFHLSLQFEDWMTLENYGRREGCWSIDHIDPVDSFNITSLDCNEFKKCWALENLRPLRHNENLEKGCRLLSSKEREKAKSKAALAAVIARSYINA